MMNKKQILSLVVKIIFQWTTLVTVAFMIMLRLANPDMSEVRFIVEFWQLYLIVALSAAGIVICAKIEIALRGE